MDRIAIVRTLEGRFEEAVIAYLFIVNLLPIIIVPLMWYESRKIANWLNSWADFEVGDFSSINIIAHSSFSFQAIYFKTVGKPLQVELETKAVLISILLPLLSAGSVVLTHYVIRLEATRVERMFLLQVVPYCYLDTLTYMLGAFWYLACEVISYTARVLAEDFQKVE